MKKDKKKNNKIIIISIVVLVIILMFMLVISIINDRKKNLKNMQIIKDNYNELSIVVDEYNQIRIELANKLNNFIYENYSKEHEEYIELLTKYNNNIKNIDKNIDNINSRCNVIYEEANVNKICNTHKVLYEKLINLYIIDLTNYNNKIISYNEYKKEEISLFNLIHDNYIDYNEDDVYEGVDLK